MLKELQRRQAEWAKANFGNQESVDYVLGAAEEVGELAHAFLKRKQDIRNNEDHNEKLKDAIGDTVIFLAGLCNMEALDFESVVKNTWEEVEQRDWKKNPDCISPEEAEKEIKGSGFKVLKEDLASFEVDGIGAPIQKCNSCVYNDGGCLPVVNSLKLWHKDLVFECLDYKEKTNTDDPRYQGFPV